MEEGWELGKYSWGGEAYFTLQKNGLGRGGDAKHVQYRTGASLRKKGFIESVGGWNPEKYVLSEFNKKDDKNDNL